MSNDHSPSFSGAARWRALVAASLVGAMAIGVWLRWALAGVADLALPFVHVRHAHSHLGYFGLLFPLAWLGWAAAGARVPGKRALVGYALCTGVAFAGFLRSGYGAVAIAGSTAVAAYWLWSCVALWPRLGRLCDPLGAVPFGLVASLACVPPIAIYLRSAPALAQGFVSTFLSGLLFVVVLPSALASRRISPGPWPLFLLAGLLGALYLGAAPHPITQLALVLYAALLLAPVLSRELEVHARVAWLVVAFGLAALAVGLVPNVRPVALGAIHFLILGPVLATVAPLWLAESPPAWAWWPGHASWGLMSVALALQGFIGDSWTWTVAAVGGTATLAWWCAVLLHQRKALPGNPFESAQRSSQ